MKELYPQNFPPVIERNPIEDDKESGCLANTIISICSHISGIELTVPDMYYKWRGMMQRDILQIYRRHVKRAKNLSREHYDAATIRLDQRAVTKFIDTASDGRGVPLGNAVLQTILQDVIVEYKKGGMETILNEIELGRQVGVTYKVNAEENEAQAWHIAHIGFDNGELVSFSDKYTPLTPTDVNEIDKAADYLNNTVRSWNFVSVKKFGD